MTSRIPMEMDFSLGADPQHQSIFFSQLPREVRDLIYAEFWAVSGARQHVFVREVEDEETGDEEGKHRAARSKAVQHSRRRRVLTHFPCMTEPGAEDTRSRDFDRVWQQQQARFPQSTVHDALWARRMASTWHDHWRCEEAMLVSRAQRRREGREGPGTGTLFLPVLLTCKRIYTESMPTLYQNISLILTSLPLAHALFCVAPSPHLAQLSSLELSLSIRFTQLHGGKSSHAHHAQQQPTHRSSSSEGSHASAAGRSHESTAGHTLTQATQCLPSSLAATALPWPALCAELSRLAESGSLQSLVLRLDVADRDDADDDDAAAWAPDAGGGGHAAARPGRPSSAAFAALDADDRHDRFWWEVRETRALAALRPALRRRARVLLPEVTVDVPRMRAFQFRATRASPGLPLFGSSCTTTTAAAAAASSSSDVSPSSSSSAPAQPSWRLPSPPADRPGDALRVPADEFQALERYPRRRWKREDGRGSAVEGHGARDGLQARLEFFSPQEHVPETAMFLGGDSGGSWGNNSKVTDLFRGMMIC